MPILSSIVALTSLIVCLGDELIVMMSPVSVLTYTGMGATFKKNTYVRMYVIQMQQSMYAYAQCMVVLYCTCNRYLYFLLHQFASLIS